MGPVNVSECVGEIETSSQTIQAHSPMILMEAALLEKPLSFRLGLESVRMTHSPRKRASEQSVTLPWWVVSSKLFKLSPTLQRETVIYITYPFNKPNCQMPFLNSFIEAFRHCGTPLLYRTPYTKRA